MANVKQIMAITKLLDNVLHKQPDGELWEYDEGWDDKRAGEDAGMSAAQVRAVRTQLGRKLVPKETGFEKLVRLHNELANRTANGDLCFLFASEKKDAQK